MTQTGPTANLQNILSELWIKVDKTGQFITSKDHSWCKIEVKPSSVVLNIAFSYTGNTIKLEILKDRRIILRGYSWSIVPTAFTVYLGKNPVFKGRTETKYPANMVIYDGKTTRKPQKPLYAVKRKGKTSILYFISTTMIGGAETVLKRLLREIDRTQYQIEVIITHHKGPLHKEYAEHSDSLCYASEHNVLDLPSWMVAKARQKTYDYIHFFNLFKYYDVIPKIKASCENTRIIVTLAVDFFYHRNTWSKELESIRRIRKHLWAFTTDARINKQLFKDITVIHDGIPIKTFSPGQKKPKTVAWVGRLTPAKKARLIPQIAQGLPDYKFTMIGDRKTDEYKKIMSMKQPNLNVRIGLTERQVADVLSETQYFIFTSHSEAMPLTVLEAMSSECCVIAEKVGDIPTVIQHGINGYLIPKDTDQVKWIINKIGSLNLNTGKAARRKVLTEYTLDQMTKHYEFLYGVMGKHHNQTRIAFLWGYPNFHTGFWENKIDSMQSAIARLSKNNVVQVFVPTDATPHRKILNGQNIYFYKYKQVKDIIILLRNFRPHMVFMNMFRDRLWPHVIKAFPKTWKSIMHYGDKVLKIPHAKNLDVIIVQQDYLRKKVASANNVPLEKVQTCTFCIEEWLFKPKNTEKTFTGVMVADFRRDIKRQGLLIRAWKNIPGNLLLIGRYGRSRPKAYHKNCIHLARSIGLEKRITFMDEQPHTTLSNLINKAKIAFLTSEQEGGSRALMEMMSCGLPALVLSDCPGTTNMIKKGVDGLIAKPTEESIARETAKLLKNYREMGEKASKRIRKEHPYRNMYLSLQGYVIRHRPEISIITTSMNRGKYIEQNINSVHAQGNHSRINHIIMDGGSKDNTLKILKKHRTRIHSYIKRDRGQTDALVRAMEIIETCFPQTSYIGWINADDYYQPNWLKESLPQIRTEPPNVAVTCGDVYRVGQHDGTIHYTSKRYIDLNLLGNRGNIIIQPTILIRLSAFKKLKDKYGYYFNPKIHYVQDLELWYRFLINGYKIKHLTKGERGLNIVANLRSHSEQMSRTHSAQQTVERDIILRQICIREKIKGPPWMVKEL